MTIQPIDDLPRWEYATPGPLRERLNGLTLVGAKTTTFGLEVFESIDDDPIPTPGQRWALFTTAQVAIGVIEVTKHERMRLADVTWDLADREGESFVSVEDWRERHEAFWAQFLPEIRAFTNDPGWSINDDTVVTCTHIRVVEHLPGQASARFAVVECVLPADEVEWVSAELIDNDATGIEEIAGAAQTFATNGDPIATDFVLLRAGFASELSAVRAEAALDRRWRPRFEVLVGDEWLDAWREYFEPQQIGRLLVVPDWDGAQQENDSERDGVTTVLRLDPARSFGTGAHPSTRLMIEALQLHDLTGRRVLDVGCGSGVLSVAALLLGAESAHGTDIEDAALDVTTDNAARNDVASRCTVSPEIPQLDGNLCTYDVVLANILAPVLIEISPRLRAAMTDNGQLFLAGLIADQVHRVLTAFPDLTVENMLAAGDWRCIVLGSRPN